MTLTTGMSRTTSLLDSQKAVQQIRWLSLLRCRPSSTKPVRQMALKTAQKEDSKTEGAAPSVGTALERAADVFPAMEPPVVDEVFPVRQPGAFPPHSVGEPTL